MNIYKTCPVLENEEFLLRLFDSKDCDDLLKVYSDKKALPFFNSDNCDGDNFYYPTKERMLSAMDFWRSSYEKGWFVRFSIVDKNKADKNKADKNKSDKNKSDKENSEVIGTVELCLRSSDDEFNQMGILRVDVRSDYEEERKLYSIFSLVSPKVETLLGCKGVLTKAPIYAVERIKAIEKVGFTKSEHLLIGKTGYAYDGYWTMG